MQNLRKQENQNKIKIEIITQKPDSLINKLFPTTVKTPEENEEGECVYDMDHLKLVVGLKNKKTFEFYRIINTILYL